MASKKLAAKQAVSLGKRYGIRMLYVTQISCFDFFLSHSLQPFCNSTSWVLDPVGCGATPYRTRACLDMLRCGPAVVRGNGSEIIALSGAEGERLI